MDDDSHNIGYPRLLRQRVMALSVFAIFALSAVPGCLGNDGGGPGGDASHIATACPRDLVDEGLGR